MLAAIAATPVETSAFATLDRSADARLLRLLAPEDAAAVREAADERRRAIGEEIFEMVEDDLDDMDGNEQSLTVIAAALRPGIDGWPASAAGQTPRLLEAVVQTRNTLLAPIPTQHTR